MTLSHPRSPVRFSNVSGIILTDSEISFQKGLMAFDTGAMQTAINSSYFKDVSGRNAEIVRFSESLGGQSAQTAVLDTVRSCGLEIKDIEVLVTDLSYVEAPLRTVDADLKFLGTLGIDVIKNFRVLIDYENSLLTLDPEEEISGSVLPLYPGALHSFDVKISGENHRFILDTGANACVIDKSLADKISLRDSELAGAKILESIDISDKEYKDILCVISDMSGIRQKVEADGIIGYQFLAEQRVEIDYQKNVLTIEK